MTGTSQTEPFQTEISRHIWDTKYRYRLAAEIRDESIQDTWRRVAQALSSPEPDRQSWEERFYAILEDFRFLPGGRIQAGAGTQHRVTLFNCFVMGVIDDSLDGIFGALKEGALTMQKGGGVGYDFSTLRPRGTAARTVGAIASGPVSFMRVWNAMCATVLSTGARRGAMMATLRCDHPDIEDFVTAKQQPGELVHFNMSVQATDELLEAVRRDDEWPLVFPADSLDDGQGPLIRRRWTGRPGPVACRVIRVVRARQLWDQIMRSTYDHAEPGVLFIDRVNRRNNLAYGEHISATNPCGEVPLPPYGACNLGSVNLTRFVHEPLTPDARLDLEAIAELVPAAVRLLDNVIDVSHYPLGAQAEQARGSRRVGLGITGLADALILLGLDYDSEEARNLASSVMETLCHAAYRASIELAREKGSFPFFEANRFLESDFIASLPENIRAGIRSQGLRNSHLTAIAPTGTISLLANNVSSGLEPVYDFQYRRRVLELDGSSRQFDLTNYAWRLWQESHGDEPPPPQFVTAQEVPAEAHLEMQAALQPFVDQAISKTIHVAEEADFESFQRLYESAWEKGLKGCTTFRPNPVTGAVLSPEEKPALAPHCCTLEREAD